MNPPKVSIIIPFPKNPGDMEACMERVLGQTLPDIEVLCVADGEICRILERYARVDPRVKILEYHQCSMGGAKNLAIRSASGVYIGFVGAGDAIAPAMYECLARFADVHPQADVIKCDYDSFVEMDGRRFFSSHKILGARWKDYEKVLNPRKHSYLFGLGLSVEAGIYRRSFLTKYNLRYREEDGAAFEDHAFWFQVFALANGVSFLPQAFYRYRTKEAEGFIDARKGISLCDAYDFAERRVRNYRGVMDAVWRPYLGKRYEACSLVLRRVKMEERGGVVRRMHEDFTQRIPQEREIDKIFSPVYYRRMNRELKLLLQHPEAYLEDINEQTDVFSRRRNALAAWASRKRTAIFGAGELGTTAQILLARQGVYVDVFVDDDASKISRTVNGVSVTSLSQVKGLQETQFLIAVGKQGNGIKKRLQEAGVKDGDIKRFEVGRLLGLRNV